MTKLNVLGAVPSTRDLLAEMAAAPASADDGEKNAPTVLRIVFDGVELQSMR